MDAILKDNEGNFTFQKMNTVCKSDMRTIHFKAPSKNNVTVTLTFTDIDELVDYTVVQYDIFNNKIEALSIDLYTKNPKININNSATDYVIIEKYIDDDDETVYYKRKIVTKDELEKATNKKLIEPIFALNHENELTIYQFEFTLDTDI